MKEVDSRYARLRLALAVLISTIGSVGMWSVVVALPAVQAEFGAARGGASLPYTLDMLGFGAGGILLGRLWDRFGIALPLATGGAALGIGYALSGMAHTLWQFAALHGLLIGFGSSAGFGPLIADISLWFRKRRGLAVSICACGNYLAGAIWPPVVQHFIQMDGWRPTQIGIGVFCAITLLPLALVMRQKPRAERGDIAERGYGQEQTALDLSRVTLQSLLIIAGFACCMAMAMPQVHIVAYCGDLGYGPARGAQMLSLMLGLGMVSRIGSGWIADRIGGIATLLLGSALQGLALVLYLLFNGLTSLYIVSGLFGLFQGGIVPSYAIIVREYFVAAEAGTRIGIVMMATLMGMAVGGWMAGAIFDFTGSYEVAFANGLVWNLVNGAIVVSLLLRRYRSTAPA
ncbi:MAG: MFS transporter [Acetobacteraceae bacterium]|nr:MFS transporter [Acetobacteraceae bacterium]